MDGEQIGAGQGTQPAELHEDAGARDQLASRCYDLGHTFSRPMQEEAFDWLDRWLKP